MNRNQSLERKTSAIRYSKLRIWEITQKFYKTYPVNHFQTNPWPNWLFLQPQEKAIVFTRFMEDQFTINLEAYTKKTIRTVNRTLNNMNFITPFYPIKLVTPREVLKFTRKLRSKSAGGLDGFPATTIKQVP